MSTPQDIRSLTLTQLEQALKELGEPAFRGRQIYEWLWKKGAREFSAMTNLSLPLRDKLQSHFSLLPASIHTQQKSKDGTIKCSFILHD
ncbi:MAG: 23S rRNA (adenine(2503)-C(2))-methyltransferase RlmN, partial [Bacteroidetes bacterium]|nr:23S rRNA (adenine(2503)-C(2))-methyltransferase RlmN [Bacteroidota bacterium]